MDDLSDLLKEINIIKQSLTIYKPSENIVYINDGYNNKEYTCSNYTCYCNELYEWSCPWCLFDYGFVSINYNFENKSYYFDLLTYDEIRIDLNNNPLHILKPINYISTNLNNYEWTIINNPKYDYLYNKLNNFEVIYIDYDIICMKYNELLLFSNNNPCKCDLPNCKHCLFKANLISFNADPYAFTNSRWNYK